MSLQAARPLPPGLEPIPGSRMAGACLSESALWERWRNEADETARERLLDLHMPYARIVAASYYAKRMHDEIEFGDYLQLASLGLIEALGRFDPKVGVLFRTYAARRMHGAILDGLEQQTEKQQQIAARQRIQAHRNEVIKEGAGNPHGRRAGATAPSEPDQVLRYVAEVGLAFALSWILDGTGMMDLGERSENLAFYRSVELEQLRKRIVDLVDSLPAQEKHVIRVHYFQEETFEKIAEILHLSRGRISQLHRKALLRLKDALRAQQDCDVSW